MENSSSVSPAYSPRIIDAAGPSHPLANGGRNGAHPATPPLAYRARPLGGLWATPPCLHNGSVPNLYQMLVPADQRDMVFHTGGRAFDPKNVGYSTAKFDGGFEFRTDRPNDPHPNSNAVHEFRNTPCKGVIGRELSDEERLAIIEYLKTL